MKYSVFLFERFTMSIVLSFASTEREDILAFADVIWKHVAPKWQRNLCVYVTSSDDNGDIDDILFRIPDITNF